MAGGMCAGWGRTSKVKLRGIGRLAGAGAFRQRPGMNSEPEGPPSVALIVPWVIWFAILNGFVMIQFFVGGGIPDGKDLVKADATFYLITAVMAVVSLGIRTLWLPSVRELQQKLVAMIIGMASAEGIGILGAVAVDKQLGQVRLVMFVTAVCCLLVYVPFYMNANRAGSGLRGE